MEAKPYHPGFCINIHANFLQIAALNNSIIISPIRLKVAPPSNQTVSKDKIRSTTSFTHQQDFIQHFRANEFSLWVSHF